MRRALLFGAWRLVLSPRELPAEELQILGRIASDSEEATNAAWDRGEREVVIRAALSPRG